MFESTLNSTLPVAPATHPPRNWTHSVLQRTRHPVGGSFREAERSLSLGSAWELKEVTVAVRLAEGGQEMVLKTYKLVRKDDS